MDYWKQVQKHFQRLEFTTISSLFSDDPDRASRYSICVDGLLFDYSKTLIDDLALASLHSLLQNTCDLELQRDAMFSGAKINVTENRAVLHTALRRPENDSLIIEDVDVLDEVQNTLNKIEKFAKAVRNGDIAGTGGKITDVINIGIGGSNLGPQMACYALTPFANGPKVHFISNIDGAQLSECLSKLNPSTTLIIVASKTFTTIETMTNARSARSWMLNGTDAGCVNKQFAAVSSNIRKCVEFGINSDYVFGFQDWVGGRYSLWGPVGLPIMISVGPKKFRELLQGGHRMDRHFVDAPLTKNLPIIHALMGIWHHQVSRNMTQAILPYDYRLRRFPAYLQQLIMESNGKSVTISGEILSQPSASVIWGEQGTDGQHAFFQALHQGRQVVPCEFLVAAEGHESKFSNHHNLLVANCLAQSETLMNGRETEFNDDLSLHRNCPGNRPSTMLVYPKLTPSVLGQLIALYEHSVFVEGLVLQINSFDQWGVELGKEMANELLPAVEEDKVPHSSSGSTKMLLNYIQKVRQNKEYSIK